jgi:RTX calcium-binding nonapeptide repeat (4 copies)
MRIFKVVKGSFALLVPAALVALAGWAAVGTSAALAVPAAAATPKCTIVGTPGPDVLHGTPGADVICGGSGRNLLRGGPGANTCRSGSESGCARSPRAKAQQVEFPPRAPILGETGTPCTAAACFPSPPPPDEEPPVLERLEATRSLDLAAGPGQIEIWASAWDAGTPTGLGEVASATVNFTAADGSPFASFALSHVEGMDWHGSLPVPAGSATGCYSIESVELVDRAGNVAVIDHQELAEEIIDATEFTVYEGPDVEAPSIESLEITPTSTKTAAGPADIGLRYRATDSQSGVQYAWLTVTVATDAPPFEHSYGGPQRLVAGTQLDGTHETVLELPQWAYPGAYRVSEVVLVDYAGNEARIEDSELEERGFQTEFEVAGPGDTTAPEILGVTLEPATIPAAGGTVVAYVHVRDDLAGFGEWPNKFFSDIYLAFGWPAHEGPTETTGEGAELVSGDDLDGTWKLEANFAAAAPAGYYPVEGVGAYDRAGNGGPLRAEELEARGWHLGFTKLP